MWALTMATHCHLPLLTRLFERYCVLVHIGSYFESMEHFYFLPARTRTVHQACRAAGKCRQRHVDNRLRRLNIDLSSYRNEDTNPQIQRLRLTAYCVRRVADCAVKDNVCDARKIGE